MLKILSPSVSMREAWYETKENFAKRHTANEPTNQPNKTKSEEEAESEEEKTKPNQ